MDPLDIPTPFESFEDYWRPFLNDVGPAPGYCSGLPAEQRRELEALLRDALPTDPDGMILLAARAWAVSGSAAGSGGGRAARREDRARRADPVVIFPANVWEYDVLDHFPFNTPEAKAPAEEAKAEGME